jgi:hypothetical protein
MGAAIAKFSNDPGACATMSLALGLTASYRDLLPK